MKRHRNIGISKCWLIGAIILFGSLPCLGVGPAVAQEKPQYGGILNFAVGAEPPSFDPHREINLCRDSSRFSPRQLTGKIRSGNLS